MPADDDPCVPVVDATVLMRPAPGGGWTLPRLGDLAPGPEPYALGDWHGRSLWLVDGAAVPARDTAPARAAASAHEATRDTPAAGPALVPLDWEAVTSLPDRAFVRLLVRASQLARWRRARRFCGACGQPSLDVPGQTARRCPACGLMEFAAAKPVVIVAVVRPGPTGPQVLLVRHTYGRTDLWTLVGGYVDPAETLEQAAVREVAEEVGLAVTDLRYHGSDGWGLTAPGVLAVAFAARPVDPGQEPTVDGREIAEARYVDLSALPTPLPPDGTVAAALLSALAAGESTVD